VTKVFIAGSMNIKHLDLKVKERIDNIIASNLEILIGDADGVDTSIQQYLLSSHHSNITIYCSGSNPRNNLGQWIVNVVNTQYQEGSRAFFTAKDIAMAEAADFGLMIWDTKSTGTLNNVIELLTRKKKSVIYINKEKSFKTVGSVNQLEELIASDHSKRKADEKIKLFERINSLKHLQTELFC
jgi:hypothetical protein